MSDNNINSVRIDINYLTRYLYSDSITKEDVEKLENYINILDLEELQLFKCTAEQLKQRKKYHGMKKYKITSNSINLSIKIYDHTNIKTFPYIDRIASKGWSISDGTFAWGMYLLDTKHMDKMIYSDWRVSICLQKRFKLKYDTFNNFDMIALINTKDTEPEIERWA